jgi:TetR/AcrR family transcriptional repressor of mexJK operon
MSSASRADATKARILDAALEAFIADGYAGTSTDQVAARAAASKQTVYKYFGDKPGLFRALADDITSRARDAVAALKVDEHRDGEEVVRAIARRLVERTLDDRVQRIRRLVIAEALRFPEVGQTYYEGAFRRVLGSVADALQDAADRGWLHLHGDPKLAADHLAGLLLWLPVNHIMMTGQPHPLSPDAIDAIVEPAVRVFLAAYGPQPADRTGKPATVPSSVP